MSDVLEELTALGPDGLQELLVALCSWASRCSRRRPWRNGNPLVHQAELETLVAGVVEKFLSNTRTWSRASGHPIRAYLFRAVESEVANQAARTEHSAPHDPDAAALLAADQPDPEQATLSADFAAALESELYAIAGEDVQLSKLVELWMEGVHERSELAVLGGWTDDQTAVLIRKMRRRLERAEVRKRVDGGIL